MIEIIIERWKQRDGRTDFLWSLWRDGKRVTMGQPKSSAAQAEGDALESCKTMLKQPPDRVTRL